MKNLIFIFLLTLSLASCKSTSKINNVDYTINDDILYHKGVQIGYLEAVKLQEKDDEIRTEYVFVIKNETEPIGKAREIIAYLRSRIPNADIELKTLCKK